jgi:hypothetical protein
VISCSKLDRVVSLSTDEYESRFTVHCIKMAVWMRWFMAELEFAQEGPTVIFVDSASAIAAAENPIGLTRRRHYRMASEFIQYNVARGVVRLVKVPTDSNTADLCPKSLYGEAFIKHANRAMGY